MERLQKVISNSGITSRRKAEQLIVDGRVKVNGEVCTKLGTVVSDKDIISVDDQVLELEEKVYLVMNKPRNYLSTVKDDRGRPVITDLVTDVSQRIYPVGRLDFDTTGVIILTNDGDFANAITHPSKHTQKTYRVSIKGPVKPEKLNLLATGVEIDGVKTLPAYVEFIKFNPENGKSTLTITIFEGKNHQVKRMFEAIGYEVVKLHRISVGMITDKGLKFGQYRDLTDEEIESFFQD
jgi:23S rRNA pseudouridine2605 synthase